MFLAVSAAVLGSGVTASGKANEHVTAIAPYVYPMNSTARPENFTYLPDGTAYLTLSSDGKKIMSHDIKTGNETEAVFDVVTARETTGLERIEGFIVSPEGSKFIVWVDSEPIYRRSSTAKYYIYERHSKLLRPLSKTFERQQAPLFSPNGRMVAFVAENNIYMYKWDYKTEVAVTTDGKKNSIINGVPDWTYEEEFSTNISMSWSPDNLGFCYLKYNETEVPLYSFPLYEGNCPSLTQYALYPGSFTYKYPVAGQPNSVVTLHSYDVETRKTKDITLPDPNIEYIPRISYANSSDLLLACTLNRDQNHFEIYAVNPKSTVCKSIYVEKTSAWVDPVAYENIKLYPDYFVVTSSRSGFNHLYQYSYAGALMKQLTKGDFEVTNYYGADAQGNHYYQAASPSPLDRNVYCLDKKGNTTMLSKEHGTSSASFSPDMQYCVLNFSDVTTPPVYTFCRMPQMKVLRTLEDNAEVKARFADIPVKEFFTMPAGDGLTLNGWMLKPKDFSSSQRYPVVMYQYSGPGSQEVLNRWHIDWEYYFVKQGYIVMCVDGRGTGARGRAFMDVVYRNLGHYETIDQLAAARYAASLPYTDAKRIGIFGWSFGGYETLMAATSAGAPYAAAVAVAPVTDWRYYDTVYAERYMLTPQQNEQGYNESAPINRAANLECPLLIMSGTADDNVHQQNTLQFVSELQNQGILCDMLMFPNKNHSIFGCNARAVVYAKMLDFFNKNMR